MRSTTLPNNWCEATFEDVLADISNGISDSQNKEAEGIPVSRIETIATGKVNLAKIGYVSNISESAAERYLLNPGDILFSHINSPAHIGKTAIFRSGRLYHGTNVLRIRTQRDTCTPEYFEYYCRYFRSIGEFSMNAQHAVNQSSLNQKKIKAFTLPLPPLAEQTRIAQKLDELLAQVDTLKARIDAITALLKRFRQSVLAAAVSGRLTEEWQGSDYGEWSSGILGDFVGVDVGYAFKSSEFSTTGVRLLRGQNIEPGALRWTETKFYPEEKLTGLEGLFIAEGDIILAMDRPIVSAGLKLARARKRDLPCVLVQRVSRFKSFRGVTPDYLMLLLSDLSFSNYLLPNQTGSDIPHISGKQILNYHVTLPTTIEQTEIVRRVEQLFAFTDQLETKIQTAQARVNHLTQSILAKAFRGELVPQDPNDEPASVLLERIQAQRAAEPKAKRGRKASV